MAMIDLQTTFTKLPGSMHEGLRNLEADALQGDDDFGTAAQLLEIARRVGAAIEEIKNRQYNTRIGVVGESEAVQDGVKVKVTAPSSARTVNTTLTKALDNDPTFRRWLNLNGYPEDLYRTSHRRGGCSITEVR